MKSKKTWFGRSAVWLLGIGMLLSIRSAILFRTRARSAALVRPQLCLAPCAASSASSMSSPVERAISVNVWPLTGEGFSKYPPLLGGTNSPPMKFPYRSCTDTRLSD